MLLKEISRKKQFLNELDHFRALKSQNIQEEKKAEFSQYFTQVDIAKFMASKLNLNIREVSILDPGAGIGSLSAAFVYRCLNQSEKIDSLKITCYEKDTDLIEPLNSTMVVCKRECEKAGISFSYEVHNRDFIEDGAKRIVSESSLFYGSQKGFTHCIMNPPYKKINSNSVYRKRLSELGIEVSNLYAGFFSLATEMLRENGEIVAIIPRSFCNGVYFKKFRSHVLEKLSIQSIHLFNQRNKAFSSDSVLQENIIIHAAKSVQKEKIKITTSDNSSFTALTEKEISFKNIVNPKDKHNVIHLVTSDIDQLVLQELSVFTHSLEDLNVKVSTGPVVDFRMKSYIDVDDSEENYPLIYPSHFSNGTVAWPKPKRAKANYIKRTDQTKNYLFKKGLYIVTKRFSSKEEKRRIYAAEYNPDKITSDYVGFENHLNVFHSDKSGLEPNLARGIKTYLNSTLIDKYFRQFSGHTQVNVSDLKRINYPSPEILKEIGSNVTDKELNQKEVDEIINSILDRLTPNRTITMQNVDQKVEEAIEILKALGLPKAQQNDRSALTLLSLLDIKPDSSWSEASAPLMGITPIMDYIQEHYGINYAPNTRETIRRQTMHQFVDAGIVVENPDEPLRPINSPKWVYQIEETTLDLIKKFGTDQWDDLLSEFLESYTTLKSKYSKKRKMNQIPLKIDGETLSLSPGRHSKLIKDIVDQFGPRYAPNGTVLYVGDTGSKLGYYDEEAFKKLGLEFDSHGKFPDVVIHYTEKNWLLLIEAVTSHGPVNPKRLSELKKLFSKSKAGIVYVTAFPDKKLMAKYVSDISWETEVWIAENPGHLVHFDGKRFLGPY